MFYAINWFLSLALLALWSLACWALHAVTVWVVSSAGALAGGSAAHQVVGIITRNAQNVVHTNIREVRQEGRPDPPPVGLREQIVAVLAGKRESEIGLRAFDVGQGRRWAGLDELDVHWGFPFSAAAPPVSLTASCRSFGKSGMVLASSTWCSQSQ